MRGLRKQDLTPGEEAALEEGKAIIMVTLVLPNGEVMESSEPMGKVAMTRLQMVRRAMQYDLESVVALIAIQSGLTWLACIIDTEYAREFAEGCKKRIAPYERRD